MTTMNRLHNSRNPFQGTNPKVLCVCSAGLLRSPTLAVVLASKGFNTRAAGIVDDYALVPVDEVLVQWADKILCVEDSVYHQLCHKFPGADVKAKALGIPDCYAYMDPKLVKSIEAQLDDVKEWLNYE